MKQSQPNPFFPCQLIEHDAHYSVITSNFHYFDEYFADKGCGGYTLQNLAKKIAKEQQIKEIKFDSEAGMFCAYSQNRESLLRLCQELRKISGDEEKNSPKLADKPKINEQKATELLLLGFVMTLDEEKQQEFLENVPFPPLSSAQIGYLTAIENGNEAECISALKKVNSEARTKVRNYKNYLSHPKIITILFNLLDKNPSEKVQKEVFYTLFSISGRHLPDLRCRNHFYDLLSHKKADFRRLGVLGLGNLYDYDLQKVKELANDKSEAVRQVVAQCLNFGIRKNRSEDVFAPWMFSDALVKKLKN
ncbi:immunity 51 family protein [Capnocytophaga catalasegens]|uniref:HEAT repeat domain-containing protein n=1 Tax=Capnocytophaga catalasegens TaxID=1004260 RepID=A0AAV5ATF5_9FLAO|nr:immunity 51 family protein [Capnocytophaga catalasegens]GIZ14428.1 hypothetical protein RCZ03_04290 [Capnocytophaga catalasegens]GJM50624.1 hypothetical protein RCZ15_15970 [Capnocytophaga catalasegens]GJM53361.1 hypothetical protein RCZ16_16780 [Capnocytophaga catalasegens]